MTGEMRTYLEQVRGELHGDTAFIRRAIELDDSGAVEFLAPRLARCERLLQQFDLLLGTTTS